MTKKVLVTGIGGFVGSTMVEHLDPSLIMDERPKKKIHDEEYEVIGTDFTPPNPTDEFKKRKDRLGNNFIEANLLDKGSLKNIFEKHPDISGIFHIAAIFKFTAGRRMLFNVNVDGVQNLYEAAAEANLKNLDCIVHWSSAAIYGETGKTPVKENGKMTDRPNDYEESKMEGERVALEVAKDKKLPLTVIRPSAMYGPGSTYGTTTVFYLLKFFAKYIPQIWVIGKPFPLPGNPDAITNHLHVEDCVRAVYHLYKVYGDAKKKDDKKLMNRIKWNSFNVAEPKAVTVKQLAKAGSKEVGVNVQILPAPPGIVKAGLDIMLRALNTKPVKELSPLIHLLPEYLETDTIDYLYNNHAFDTSALTSLPGKFKYMHHITGEIGKTLEWYDKHDAIMKGINDFHKKYPTIPRAMTAIRADDWRNNPFIDFVESVLGKK